MSEIRSKQSPLIPILIVAIVALLAALGYMWKTKSDIQDSYTTTAEKLDETEQLKLQLNTQYYESLNELESMRGSNAELNALIDQQKAEIIESKKRIDVLMKDKKNLSAARKEIASLKSVTAGYVQEINALKEANGLLTEQNTELVGQNEGLQRTVADVNASNSELSTARAALMSEKENLLGEREVLTEKVTMASSIKVNNISSNGLRMKDNGKTVRKKYAKNVDLLNICFETSANQIAKSGNEEFFVRIINPLGETLAIEEMGSGVLVNALTKEQVRYTKAVEHQYSNGVGEVCVTWDAPSTLAKGDYGVQVYNKNYLAGEGKFTLK